MTDRSLEPTPEPEIALGSKPDWRALMSSLGDAPVDLYVMTDGQRVKVGISTDAEARRFSIQADRKTPICLCYVARVSGALAEKAEAFAHWLLRPTHTSGEWFSATIQQAISAVSASAAAVALRPDLPGFCARAHWRPARHEDSVSPSSQLRTQNWPSSIEDDEEDGSL